MGVFATLTNSYAIVAIGASENFYRYATQGTVTWADRKLWNGDGGGEGWD